LSAFFLANFISPAGAAGVAGAVAAAGAAGAFAGSAANADTVTRVAIRVAISFIVFSFEVNEFVDFFVYIYITR
jgi:hypothetical protein